MACKLQGALVTCYSKTTKFLDQKERAASVVAQAVVTHQTKLPQLTVTYVPPPTPSIEKKPFETVPMKDPPPTSTTGKFGRFGGKFVPETLVACLSQLEAEFKNALCDDSFKVN